MKLVLEGSLSEIRNEMREFLGYGDADVLAAANATIEQQMAVTPPAPAVPAMDLPPVAEKPAKPRKAKAEPQPTAAPAPEATVAVVEAAQPTPPVAAVPAYPTKSLDEVRAAIADLVTAKGVPVAKALLSRFGVGRAQDAHADRFGEIEAKARATIAGTFDPNAA